MSKTLSLGLVIRAVGFGAAAHELGTVDKRIEAIGVHGFSSAAATRGPSSVQVFCSCADRSLSGSH